MNSRFGQETMGLTIGEALALCFDEEEVAGAAVAEGMAAQFALGADGGTFNAAGRLLDLTEGFVVGGKAKSLVFGSTLDFDEGLIREFVADHEADFYGFWVDGVGGAVYVDAVDILADEDEALALARIRGELAVWAAGRGEEVRV